MKLFPDLEKLYTRERFTAREAQDRAEFIAWGPIVFQVSRLMIKFGILEMLRESDEGMTREEICQATGLSDYAVKCMTEASLCIGTILVDTETDRFTLSKTGWFLLNDHATRVNVDFNHDVNYEGWFRLEESFKENRPVGLEHFGNWPTVYEGLSELPSQVQKSWFGFDHFYSDSSFPEALEIIFKKHNTRSLYDVGGNTGKWALQCVNYDKDVEVTILDLPQQIQMMEDNVNGKLQSRQAQGHHEEALVLEDGPGGLPAGPDAAADETHDAHVLLLAREGDVTAGCRGGEKFDVRGDDDRDAHDRDVAQ